MHKEKAIQLMHFFAERNGSKITIEQLMNSLFICDFLSIENCGYPMSYDDYFSVNKNAIAWNTKQIIDDNIDSFFVKTFKVKNDTLYLKKSGSDTKNIYNVDFDLLSINEHEILEKTLSGEHSFIKKIEKLIKEKEGQQITIELILSTLNYPENSIIEETKEIKYLKRIHSKYS